MADSEDNYDPASLISLSEDALHHLMQRAGVGNYPDPSVACPTGWTFSEGPDKLDPDVRNTCAPQIQFLQAFKENWRPTPPAKWQFPDEWKPKETDMNPMRNRTGSLARCELDLWVRQVGQVFSPLSRTETVARHHDPNSFEPDFLLAVPTRYNDRVSGDFPSLEKLLAIDAEHPLEHFKPIVFYAGDERGAEAVISGAFMCIPGCWMRCNPLLRFPASMMGFERTPDIDFALLLHSLGSSREFGVRRDGYLRISLVHPALIVGLKGPAVWSRSLAHSEGLERAKTIHDAVRDLAAAVQPSLDTHLLNWQLRCEQISEVSSTFRGQLPAWFMLFGVIYDAERVVIVAHIPFISPRTNNKEQQPTSRPRLSYLSCIVDSIPFAPVSATAQLSEPWCLDRFRVAYALFSLQKHAFRLASLWESVVWPAEIALAEAELEREYLGPTPTPSDKGDELPQYVLDLGEWTMTASEQQEELDEEIKEREERSREVLPDLLEWIGDVAECAD